MADNNLDRLVKARVVPSPEALSDAERAVIDGLSEEEVDTLVGIRQKLSAELAGRSPEGGFGLVDPESAIKSNFVI
jgi:hypothetical protein